MVVSIVDLGFSCVQAVWARKVLMCSEKSVWAGRTIELGDEVCEVQRAHQREVAWVLLGEEAGLLVLSCFRCCVSIELPRDNAGVGGSERTLAGGHRGLVLGIDGAVSARRHFCDLSGGLCV